MYLRGHSVAFSVLALASIIGTLVLGIRDTNAQSSAAPGCNDLLQLASGMGRAVDSVFVNQEVCDAYRFLLERNGNGTRGVVPGCYRTQADRILRLNPQFAVGLAKALAEIERLYGGKNIIQSGYRCDGSNGNHPRGCAADIIWTSCQRDTMGFPDPWRCSSDDYDPRTDTWLTPEQKWIDANGKNAPYNIQLRLRGKPEGHHVEPVSTQGCITGPAVRLSGNTPFSGVSDAVRQAFGMPTQQAQPSPTQPAVPSQPISSSESPIQAFEPTPITDVSSQIGGTSDVTSHATSAADRLEELAFGPKPATSTTATSVPLVVSGSNAAVLTGTQQASTAPVTPSQGAISPSQTTFTSGDLSWQDQTVSSAPVSGVLAILITIRATLNRMLQYLVPFSARGNTDMYEYEDF